MRIALSGDVHPNPGPAPLKDAGENVVRVPTDSEDALIGIDDVDETLTMAADDADQIPIAVDSVISPMAVAADAAPTESHNHRLGHFPAQVVPRTADE